MDINSLLSPSESPVKQSSPATSPGQAPAQPSWPRARQPRPAGGKRTSSGLSNEISQTSPPPDAPRSTPSLGLETIVQAQRTAFTPAYNGSHDVRTPRASLDNPISEGRSPFGTPQAQRSGLQFVTRRHSSSPHVETLADLASMQQHQQSRLLSVSDVHHPPPVSRRTSYAPSYTRTISGLSSTDLAMADAPAQTPPPRVITSSSLTEEEIQTITDLVKYLSENSYAYDTHVQLINLLHQGFNAHVYGTTSEPINDPRGYSLLSDMRQAREAMDSRFAVGEDIWKDWIQDEAILARTSEERISVMELCQKAVLEEPISVTLWHIYGEWVVQTYAIANDFTEGDPNVWTDVDKEICKEVFTREIVLDVWERAVEATKWRIDESHRVWDRYIDQVLQEFPDTPSPKAIEHINTIFMMRLQIPHANWTETSSKFWPIVSKHNASGWEEMMAAANEMAAPAKQHFGLREMNELSVKRASESGDKVALYTAFNDYLTWERRNKRRSPFGFELRCALFERALLSFPTTLDWWLDYLDYLFTSNPNDPSISSVLERATRHCPWSGDMWSRRILRCEVERRSYEDVENVKHKATNSGLLDIGGMEEMLKVYSSWCGYLRRRAFAPNTTEDEIDMADMGITGTLEDAAVAGKKIYGKEYQGDPLFRLEKIRVKFLNEARRFQDARLVYERLVPTHSARSDLWIACYNFEMMVWSNARLSDKIRVETPDTAPQQATAILRKALEQRNLDWPEKIMEVYLNHFSQHETPEALQQAQVDARTATYRIHQRRAREAAEAEEAAAAAAAAATAAAAAAQPEQTTLDTTPEEASATGKRKREDEIEQNGDDSVKRNRTDEEDSTKPTHMEASSSASAQIKRDREHNTITVKYLPTDISEKRVRQFFSDCGKVLSVAILADENSPTAHATIEFETHEDVLTAKTKDAKMLDGNEIKVQSGTLSTIYVTNYPADWDEVKIRELFKDFGTITSVRLPSLKYNQRRRFCYVQFLTADEARAATVLNDKSLDGQHRLVAVISDPDAKKHRSGAVTEGRELYVGNVERVATETEIRELFAQHGTVENVRMIKNVGGKFTGTAFIIYSRPEEANAALVLNNKPLKSRLLRVSIATDKSSAQKGGATKVIESSTAESPAVEGTSKSTGAKNGLTSSVTSNALDEGGLNEETAKTRRQRTLALLKLPDTVNDARIQTFFEAYGPLRKLMVRRDKGGAIIEFVNLQDAGKVGMGIDCSSLGPSVRIGDVDELLGHRKPAVQDKKPLTSMRPAQAGISRPGQRGGAARRGGLGFKRGGLGSGASKAPEGEDKTMGGTEEAGNAKSNADFRALFTKAKEETPQEQPAGDDGGDA